MVARTVSFLENVAAERSPPGRKRLCWYVTVTRSQCPSDAVWARTVCLGSHCVTLHLPRCRNAIERNSMSDHDESHGPEQSHDDSTVHEHEHSEAAGTPAHDDAHAVGDAHDHEHAMGDAHDHEHASAKKPGFLARLFGSR